ncbi:hypothetical protein LJR235_005358 [Pararhizobium sp. LjRoot235]
MDDAITQNHDFIGISHDTTRTLLVHENAEALFSSKPKEGFVDFLHNFRRKTKTGLINEHETGPAHQSTANHKHLLLSPRHFASWLAKSFSKTGKILEDALQIALDGSSVLSSKGPGAKVLFYGKTCKNMSSFGDKSYAFRGNHFWACARNVLALKRD